MADWSKIISVGVGPMIVISACGLLCLAFYNRLAAVVSRLRNFHRERLHAQDLLDRVQAAVPLDEIAMLRQQEFIGMLHLQMQSVRTRARWIRRTLGCLLLTIACLATCALLSGLSTLVPFLVYPAVVLFVTGLLLLIGGVVCALIEIRASLDPVDLEARFVRDSIELSDDTGRDDVA